MKKLPIRISLLLTATLMLTHCGKSEKDLTTQKLELEETSTPSDESKHLYAATIAGDYLSRIIYPNGAFKYEIDSLTGEDNNDYNMIRHAGAIFGIMELYKETKKPELLKTAKKAIQYMFALSESPQGHPEMLCLIESNTVHTGGNALAILALTQYQAATGDNQYLEKAQAYGRYLLQTQGTDGNYLPHRAKYPSFEADKKYDCPYYPGEVIFALSKLHQTDQDPKWLKSAEKGADWIIHVRDKGKVSSKLNHDHWLLYGLKELHKLKPKPDYPEHAAKIVNSIRALQHKNLTGERSDWNGGYYIPPRSTPTACRGEGLGAAWWIFKQEGNKAMQDLCFRTLKAGLEFEYRNQITSERRADLKASPISHGGFKGSLNENNIRIDFVQHSICSILGYIRIPKTEHPEKEEEIQKEEIKDLGVIPAY